MSVEKKNILELLKLKTTKKIILSTHVNPDGDGLGSQLALALALASLNKEVIIHNADSCPKKYTFLDWQENFISYKQEELLVSQVLIILDCANLKRIGSARNIYRNHNNQKIIKIDHHIKGENFADINWADEKYAATGEMIWELLLDLNIIITPAIATALYTAIVNDTRCFSNSNTTAETLAIAAKLLQYGAKVNDVMLNLQSKSLSTMLLFSKVFLNLEFIANKKIGVGTVDKSILQEYAVSHLELEGLAEDLLIIKEMSIAVLFIEYSPEITRVSLRSKYDYNVQPIANYFNGGGHCRSSGMILKSSLKKAKQIVLKKISSIFYE